VELEKSFNASPLVVQRALDCLVSDGFVQARGRLGTFVTDEPPHLTRYALIFPSHKHEAQGWRNFWTALEGEAAHIARVQRRQLPIYYGIRGHSDLPEYLALVEEVQAHRLAGLIFAIDPQPFVDTPLLDEPNVPRVAITGRTVTGVQSVRLSMEAFIDKALDYLAERGRRRIAVISHDVWTGPPLQYFLNGLAARGQESRPYWIQFCNIDVPEAANACGHLLAHNFTLQKAKDRYDAIFITDDHLVAPAMAGLASGGARGIDIVAHGNFPAVSAPEPSYEGLSIRRLGFDAHDVMRACIDLIDKQRQGLAVPEASLIEPAWQEDAASLQENYQ
jgi:hypothetical protein